MHFRGESFYWILMSSMTMAWRRRVMTTWPGPHDHGVTISWGVMPPHPYNNTRTQVPVIV